MCRPKYMCVIACTRTTENMSMRGATNARMHARHARTLRDARNARAHARRQRKARTQARGCTPCVQPPRKARSAGSLARTCSMLSGLELAVTSTFQHFVHGAQAALRCRCDIGGLRGAGQVPNVLPSRDISNSGGEKVSRCGLQHRALRLNSARPLNIAHVARPQSRRALTKIALHFSLEFFLCHFAVVENPLCKKRRASKQIRT
jgi:hypothetical protein